MHGSTRSAGASVPTRFRLGIELTTVRTLERLATGSGFRIVRFDLLETKPDYLYFHPLAYRAGIVYERIVNRWPRFARFRVQIIADLKAI